MAPDSWACPACALLGVQGVTHTYLLDQPYQRQDARKMTRIESTPGVAVSGLGMTGAANHAGLSQYQSEGILQSDPAERVQPTSRSTVTESEDRSLSNRLGLDTSVPPNALGKLGISTDGNRELNPISLER
jgi:hypothetical protein